MRICVVTRDLAEDYKGNFEFDQAVALKEFGHQVYVLSIDVRSVRRKRRFGFTTSRHKGVEVLRCSLPLGPLSIPLFEKGAEAVFKKGYSRLIKKFGNMDIIHTHFLDYSFFVLQALEKMKLNIPVVVTEHSSTVNAPLDLLTKDVVEKGNYVYHKADKVLAVSESLRDVIKENFGVEATVVYNVFDNEIFKLTDKIRNIDYGDKKETIFVSAGNFTLNKRMDLLIKSFVAAFKNDDKYKLIIFGDGPQKENLKDLAEALGCQDRVVFMGRKSRMEIAEAYAGADVFALLSEKETFGVSYVEAMSCGLPVIACYSGGPENFIIPQVGMLVEADAEMIGKSFAAMADNLSVYDREELHKYASSLCSPKVIAQKLTYIYKDLIEEKRGFYNG